MDTNKQHNNDWLSVIVDDLSNNISPSAKEKLEEWLLSSEDNQKYYNELKETWQTIDVIHEANQFDSSNAFLRFRDKIHSETPLPHKLSLRKVLTYAAVVIPFLFMSYFSYSYFTENNDSSLASISVPAGATSEVTFKDGSKVWLNSGSRIEVANNFGKRERRIKLDGEAYLEVARDTKSPFIVETEEVDVKVLGTVFNVNASKEQEEVRVTLQSGSVELLFNENDKLLLKPNEQAIYNIASKSIRVEQADMNKVLAWKNNVLIFSGEAFDSITHTLERKFNVKITIHNEILLNHRFVGDFVNNETIEQILNVMSSNKKFRYTINGNKIDIY